MDHFQGVNNQERFYNDLIDELRQIRRLLERNAQTVEPAHKEVTNDGSTESGFQRTRGRKRNTQ